MRGLTLFFLILQFSFNAIGALGELLPKYKNPRSTCLIEFNSINGIYHCSGTLISPNEVKTAAHCLIETLTSDPIVTCGKSDPVKVIKSTPLFDNNFEKFKNLSTRKYDIALLTLKENLKINPVKTFSDKERIRNLLSETKECAFFGYGLNPFTEGTGFRHGVGVSPENIYIKNDLIIINEPYRAVSMIGDSGSGFLCKDDNGTWIDIGTVSAHSWHWETIVAPNFIDENFLKRDISIYLNNEFEFDELQEKIEQVRKYINICEKKINFILPEDIDKFKKTNYKSRLSYLEEKLRVCNLKLLERNTNYPTSTTYYIKPFSWYEIVDKNDNNKNSLYNTVDRFFLTLEIKSFENGYATGILTINDFSQYYLCENENLCDGTFLVKIRTSRLDKAPSVFPNLNNLYITGL